VLLYAKEERLSVLLYAKEEGRTCCCTRRRKGERAAVCGGRVNVLLYAEEEGWTCCCTRRRNGLNGLLYAEEERFEWAAVRGGGTVEQVAVHGRMKDAWRTVCRRLSVQSSPGCEQYSMYSLSFGFPVQGCAHPPVQLTNSSQLPQNKFSSRWQLGSLRQPHP